MWRRHNQAVQTALDHKHARNEGQVDSPKSARFCARNKRVLSYSKVEYTTRAWLLNLRSKFLTFPAGFRQQFVKGSKLDVSSINLGLSDSESFNLGTYLAQIHQIKIDEPLTPSTVCQSNTEDIYNHLSLSKVKWVLHCSLGDGNPPPSRLKKTLIMEMS